jgi:hypothetical protein
VRSNAGEAGSDSDAEEQFSGHQDRPRPAKRNKPGRDRRRPHQAARAAREANFENAGSSDTGLSSGSALRTTTSAASVAGQSSIAAQLEPGGAHSAPAIADITRSPDRPGESADEPASNSAEPSEPGDAEPGPIDAPDEPVTNSNDDNVHTADGQDTDTDVTNESPDNVDPEPAVHLLHDDDFSVRRHYVCSRGMHPFCRLCQIPAYGDMCAHLRDFEAKLDFEC